MFVFIQSAERLGKDRVRARFDIGSGPVDRGLLAFDGMRVGARHDDELVVATAIHGSFQPVAHFRRLDQRLARPVSAAFDRDLVFEMTARGACARHLADGPADHERAAPAGICVDQ